MPSLAILLGDELTDCFSRLLTALVVPAAAEQKSDGRRDEQTETTDHATGATLKLGIGDRFQWRCRGRTHWHITEVEPACGGWI